MSSESTVQQKQTIQCSNTYEELLRVKDEITSKLLEETKKSADLAHAQSSIEEQLRDGFETCLRNIRKEFVKRRKKFAPGVKQLEIASISICKAERTFQQFPRNSNSNIKKCKRRITAARHVLMECTQNPELFSNIQRCVNDEITFLREKLLTIPDSVCKHFTRLRTKQLETDKPSDSDSDISMDDEFITSKQINITSQQTKAHSFSSNLHSDAISKRPLKQEISKNAGLRNKSSTLNGVDLFTSDSDSLDDSFDTGSYPAMVPFKATIATDQLNPIRLTQTRTQYADVHLGSSVYTKEPNKCHEMPSPRADHGEGDARGRTWPNVGEETLSMSERRSKIFSRISRKDQNDSAASPRASQKRFLPTLPTRSDLDKEPLFSKRSLEHKTTKDRPVDEDSQTKNTNDKTSTGRSVVDKSLDVDEIEFKRTVKNTTQQIIDKLKSKCTINPTHEYLTSTMDLDDTATLLAAPCSSIFSESMDSTLISIKDSGVDFKEPSLKREGLTVRGNATLGNTEQTQSIIGHNTLQMDKNKVTAPVYNWKRVEVFKRPETSGVKKTAETASSEQSTQESKVSLAIQKFEHVCSSTKAESPRHFRSLSASGPRIRYDNSFTHNKALQPRIKNEDSHMLNNSITCLTKYNNKTINEIQTMSSSFDTPTNESSFSTLNRQTTGSNLQQICSRESRRAIRETWRQRRSHSMTPRVPANAVKVKIGPTFDFVDCFMLPSHGSKCRISGIIVLTNGYVVALDEIHCYVVLFDSNLRYLSQHNILDVPSGITGTCDTSFAVSFPFRSKFGIFKENNAVIVHQKDIHVPCKDWLTDISFRTNEFYAICKGGHIHIIDHTGAETKLLNVESNGKLLLNEAAKRIYVMGADHITRFDSDGNELSRRTDIHALSAILIGETLYVGDRNKHKIVPLSENTQLNDLTAENIKFPFAITRYQELLFVSCFEENFTVEDTRTIKVFRLRI